MYLANTDLVGQVNLNQDDYLVGLFLVSVRCQLLDMCGGWLITALIWIPTCLWLFVKGTLLCEFMSLQLQNLTNDTDRVTSAC